MRTLEQTLSFDFYYRCRETLLAQCRLRINALRNAWQRNQSISTADSPNPDK